MCALGSCFVDDSLRDFNNLVSGAWLSRPLACWGLVDSALGVKAEGRLLWFLHLLTSKTDAAIALRCF